MSLVPRCSQCDAMLDPYGREGGHHWCRKCLDEREQQLTEVHSDPLLNKRRAA